MAIPAGRSRVVRELDAAHLMALIRGDVLALRLPGFCDASTADALAERFLSHPARGAYENGPHIGRLGMAYFEVDTDEGRRRYYEQAAASRAMIREACAPHVFPIDALQRALAGAWPGGACVERIEEHEMFAGLVRIFEEGSGARPHQDVLEWDAPAGCARARELLTQLSANVYLRTSIAGGELELWDGSLDRATYEASKIPGTVALDRERLPPSALVIEPQLGELILFNSQRVHAVRPITGGRRLTATCFVGVRGRNVPLSMWS